MNKFCEVLGMPGGDFICRCPGLKISKYFNRIESRLVLKPTAKVRDNQNEWLSIMLNTQTYAIPGARGLLTIMDTVTESRKRAGIDGHTPSDVFMVCT